MTKLPLVAAGCLAVTAIAYWQISSNATPPVPPATVQLKPAVEATSNAATAAAPSKDEAAPAPVTVTATAVTTKARPRAVRRDPPAATVERAENAAPPASPEVKIPTARSMTYEQRVVDATAIAGQDTERGLLELQRLAAAQPTRPEAYEALAGISLRKRDYVQAREQIASALAHGGKAAFTIIHDHSRGNFDAGDTKATCVGKLTIDADEVKFDAREDSDRFSANWADVRDTGSNKFFGSGMGGFHVTINAAGKYKNFNLAPESKDKAEGKLILDLLADQTRRRGDKTK